MDWRRPAITKILRFCHNVAQSRHHGFGSTVHCRDTITINTKRLTRSMWQETWSRQWNYEQHCWVPTGIFMFLIGVTSFSDKQSSTSKCDAREETEEGMPSERNESTSESQSDDDRMIEAYIQSLMKDHDMILLPLGLGRSSPILLDLFGGLRHGFHC